LPAVGLLKETLYSLRPPLLT